MKVAAANHDFKAEEVVIPFGIFLPKQDALSLYLSRSKVTADFIVDRLDEWLLDTRVRFSKVTMLVIDQVYHIGVRLTQALMAEVETQISRFETLGRWFVDIAWQHFAHDTVT